MGCLSIAGKANADKLKKKKPQHVAVDKGLPLSNRKRIRRRCLMLASRKRLECSIRKSNRKSKVSYLYMFQISKSPFYHLHGS